MRYGNIVRKLCLWNGPQIHIWRYNTYEGVLQQPQLNNHIIVNLLYCDYHIFADIFKLVYKIQTFPKNAYACFYLFQWIKAYTPTIYLLNSIWTQLIDYRRC